MEKYHSGYIINDRFQLYKCIKEGKYYKLFEAGDLHIRNELRLVKVVNNYLINDFEDPEIECLKTLSDISRKGIPAIIDYGKEEDITFLATSYSQGTRLDQLMKNNTISENDVMGLVKKCVGVYPLSA